MKYRFNGLKSPLWGGLHNPLFSPFEGSSLAGGGAAAWSPLSLFAAGEKGVWYDPSDFSTMWQDTAGTTPVTAVGQSVARIDDKSGNGKHATQATPARRPLLQESGGKYYLDFDGTDDSLATAAIDFSASDEMTICVGVRKETDSSSRIIAALRDSPLTNGAVYLTGPTFTAPTFGYSSQGTVLSANNVNNATYAAPFLGVVSARSKISTDYLSGRINAVDVFSSIGDQGTGNYANDAIYIANSPYYSDYFNGRIYQMIVRGAATADLTDVEDYVAGKTGVTL